MKISTYVSVVAYAHNKQDAIAPFILQMDEFLDRHFESYEIIVVDDASTDSTFENAFAVKDDVSGNVTIVRLRQKLGSDKALFAATDLCIGDFIYELDTVTISEPHQVMLDMYHTATQSGYHVMLVLASQRQAMGLAGSLKSSLLQRFSAGQVSTKPVPMRLVTRRALYAMTAKTRAVTNRTTMYQNCGFNYSEAEQAVTVSEAMTQQVEFTKAMWLYTKALQKLPFTAAALSFSLALLLVVYGGYVWAGEQVLPEGSFFLALTSLGFSVIFFLLGAIVKGIDILLNGSNTPPYQVDEVKRINRY